VHRRAQHGQFNTCKVPLPAATIHSNQRNLPGAGVPFEEASGLGHNTDGHPHATSLKQTLCRARVPPRGHSSKHAGHKNRQKSDEGIVGMERLNSHALGGVGEEDGKRNVPVRSSHPK